MDRSYIFLLSDCKIATQRDVFFLAFSLEEKFPISCSVDRNVAGVYSCMAAGV